MGYPGTYQTIFIYVKEWKYKVLDTSDEIKEDAERLTPPLTEAQIDFGATKVAQN